MDLIKNFAISLIESAPSPATSGVSLTVSGSEGALFAIPPFNATIWPPGVEPTAYNAEIVRVTNKVGDVFTIIRQQEGTSARAIQVGDQIAQTNTAAFFAQLVPTSSIGVAGGVPALDSNARVDKLYRPDIDPWLIDWDDFGGIDGLVSARKTRRGNSYVTAAAAGTTGAPVVKGEVMLYGNTDGSYPNPAGGAVYTSPGFPLKATPDCIAIFFRISSKTNAGTPATTFGGAALLACSSNLGAPTNPGGPATDPYHAIVTNGANHVAISEGWTIGRFKPNGGGFVPYTMKGGVTATGTFEPALPLDTLLAATMFLVGNRLRVRLPDGTAILTDPDPDIPLLWGPYIVQEAFQPATNTSGLTPVSDAAGTQLNTKTTLTSTVPLDSEGWNPTGGTAVYGNASDGNSYTFNYTSITTAGGTSTIHGITGWTALNTVNTAANAKVWVPSAYATDAAIINEEWQAMSFGLADLVNGGISQGAVVDYSVATAAGIWPAKIAGLGSYFSLLGVQFPAKAGNYASTPSATANRITGNIELRAKLGKGTVTSSGAAQALVGKWGAVGSLAYLLNIGATGGLQFQWSEDGSTIKSATASAYVLPSPLTQDTWIRAQFTANNGSGAYTVTFWTSTDDGVTWTQQGTTVTGAAISSIFDASSQEVEVAAAIGGISYPYGGIVEKAEIATTFGGAAVVAFAWSSASATTYTATTGEVWTLHGTSYSFSSGVSTSVMTTADSTTLAGALQTTGGIMTGRLKLAGEQWAISSKSADYTLTTTDGYVAFDSTAANRTATLPAATGSGQRYIIMKSDSSTHTVTIAPHGTDTINGSNTSNLLATQNDFVYLLDFSAGSWLIVAFQVAPVTVTNNGGTTTWTVPVTGWWKIGLVAPGAGGAGGGAAALTGGVATQVGGGGGAGGDYTEDVQFLTASTVLSVTLAAPGTAGTGGTASTDTNGHAGTAGGSPVVSAITGGQRTIRAMSGAGGALGGANSTVTANGGGPGVGVSGTTQNVAYGPQWGGSARATVGAQGGSANGRSGAGGCAGMAATSTLGGNVGTPSNDGSSNSGSNVTSNTATTAGATPTAPTRYGDGGFGGGGGAPGGAGGNGSTGAPGAAFFQLISA